MPATFPDLDQLSRALRSLGKVLRADRVTVIGGEPLLNSQIDSLLAVLQASDIFSRTFITTNGLLLHRMSPRFWELVDVVEISVYPATRDRLERRLPAILKSAYSANVDVHLLANATFKHLVLSEPVVPASVVQAIYEECYFKNFCHTLSGDRFFKCAPCVNIGARLSLAHASRLGDDGIQVDDNPDMLERLATYLASKQPLSACNYCVGSSGSEFAHEQIDARNPVDYLPFSEGVIAGDFWEKRPELRNDSNE